eukprot:TRINITY_DN2808_c0_g2_i1.p1 TRINITY_DN2808_c0_g2~~TRINITY_DN2808_c0_g2_i1.p1  ORF type:complete len:392 (+),score=153.12 TRINITY_DN2808_c0_g2_i1:1-1176(+)
MSPKFSSKLTLFSLFLIFSILTRITICQFSNNYKMNDIFSISWAIIDDELHLTAQVQSASWVGFGWHSANVTTDQPMEKVDYVIAIFDDYGRLIEVDDRYSSASNGGFSTPKKDTDIGGTNDILWASGYQIKNGSSATTSISFVKKLNTGDTAADNPIFNNSLFYIVCAHGLSNTFSKHGSLATDRTQRTNFNFFVNNGGGQDDTNINLITNLMNCHAGFMIIAYMFCMTSGLFLARYLRSYKTSWWFPLHYCLNIFGILLAFAAFGMALYFVQGNHFAVVHTYLGIVTLALTTVAPILGLFSHQLWLPSREKTPLWPDNIHRGIGWLTIICAFVTIYLGLWQVGATPGAYAAISAWIAAFFFVIIFMEIYTRKYPSTKLGHEHDIAIEKF